MGQNAKNLKCVIQAVKLAKDHHIKLITSQYHEPSGLFIHSLFL